MNNFKICYSLFNSQSDETKLFIDLINTDCEIIQENDLCIKELDENHNYLSKFKILKNLYLSYLHCINNNSNICIFNYGNGFFFNNKKFKVFVKNFYNKKKLFSFRIDSSSGIYWNQEPRLPYVDNHFILMNIDELKNKNFFSKVLLKNCHSNNLNRDNSILSAFIEYSLERDEFTNHYNENNLKNKYGETNNLNPLFYQICEESSFVTYYKSIENTDKIFRSNFKENKKFNYKKRYISNNFIKNIFGKISPNYEVRGHNEKRIKF